MINLCEPASLYDRLAVWGYLEGDYIDDEAFLRLTVKQMKMLFDFLDNN